MKGLTVAAAVADHTSRLIAHTNWFVGYVAIGRCHSGRNVDPSCLTARSDPPKPQ